MNKRYFAELADYNCWANSIVAGWLLQINEEQWEREVLSSFSSIKMTATHIVSAEKVWIDFWTKAPDPVYLSAVFTGTGKELIEIWKEASAGMKAFIEAFSEENYQQRITFRYPRGGEGWLEYPQTFAHVMNHSTYHRGQLVTLLRQVGFTGFTSIDLATYYRLNQQ